MRHVHYAIIFAIAWLAIVESFIKSPSYNTKSKLGNFKAISVLYGAPAASNARVCINSLPAVLAAAAQVTNSAPKKRTLAQKLVRGLSKFVDPAISGGLLSGGLHAITGPDHLAALIPSSVGRSGWKGVQIGAIWGLGHGFSAFLLGMSFFFLKGQFTGRFAVLEKLANLAESVVGLSLVAIGVIGLKENMDAEPTVVLTDPPASGTKALRSSKAILANGMLHGFSWDGAPSIAPAIAMNSWRSAVTFLLSYSIGTMVAMSAAAGALGELSLRVGQASNDPTLPRKLSITSSVIAIIIGLYWLVQSLLLK